MDVHDTPELSRSQPLQPGMAITIEPGTVSMSQGTISLSLTQFFILVIFN
jgi:Xaa-Pro aminopeptidase